MEEAGEAQEVEEVVKVEAWMEAEELDDIGELRLETREVELMYMMMMTRMVMMFEIVECRRMKHNSLMENSSYTVRIVGDIDH